jgi:acyl carrier protein
MPWRHPDFLGFGGIVAQQIIVNPSSLVLLACDYCNTHTIFMQCHSCCLSPLVSDCSKISGALPTVKQCFQIDKVRALIADHLDVDIRLVTDDAHFTEDLGADWLDRLELTMLIEDQFPGLEISDDDVDQVEVVGDLIRHIEHG